jgi:hypothetical protein
MSGEAELLARLIEQQSNFARIADAITAAKERQIEDRGTLFVVWLKQSDVDVINGVKSLLSALVDEATEIVNADGAGVDGEGI